jgi:predicted nucleic acid-binding protein
MISEVVIDASVWVSLSRLDEANHMFSRIWIQQYAVKSGILFAPSFLTIEVAAAISRGTGDPSLATDALKKLHEFQALHLVPLESTLVQAAVEVATNLQLRAGDSIYVALAHQMNIPLVSWDKEQVSKASRLIPTYTPESFPL